MKNVVIAILVLVLVGGGVYGGMLVNQGALEQEQLAQQLEVAQTENSRLKAMVEDLETEQAALKEQLAAAEAVEPASPLSALADMMGTVEVPENFDPAALLEQMLPDDEAGGSMMEQMFGGEQGASMRKMSAKMMLSMQYGDLFLELGLSSEREEAVKAVLAAQMEKQLELGLDVFDGDTDMKALMEQQETAKQELEDAMREVLSDDEFALYQAYEAESEERMMRQGMEMQMGMLGAQGMTAENQALVMDTIMEEFSLLQTQDLDPVAGMQQSVVMYENTLTRLEQSMEPDQVEILARFVQQQQDMMGAMAEMFVPK